MSAIILPIVSIAALVACHLGRRALNEVAELRDLVRRCAEHLGNECHTGIQNINTNRALWAECEREGWTDGGKER